MTMTTEEAFARYCEMLDSAWVGRMCRSGAIAHDAIGRIGAEDIRELRACCLVTVLTDVAADYETDPEDPPLVRPREGRAYDRDLGYWHFLVEWGGVQFGLLSKERSGSVTTAMGESSKATQ